MTTVVDYEKLQGRRLSVRKVFAIRDGQDTGHLLQVVREQAAQNLVRTILESKDFFLFKSDSMYATLGADCFVLTEQELADLMRQKFQEGVRHATGFMPDWIKE